MRLWDTLSCVCVTVLVESPDDRLNTIRDCLINSVYMFLNISLLENAGLSFNFDALARECFLRQFVLGRKTLKLQITDRAPIRMIFFSILSYVENWTVSTHFECLPKQYCIDSNYSQLFQLNLETFQRIGNNITQWNNLNGIIYF